MKPDFPGVHEPDRMLNHLARLVAATLKTLGMRLERISFGSDGTLQMSGRSSDARPCAIEWVRESPSGIPVERFGGVVSVPHGMKALDARVVAEAVARVLGTLELRTFPMLRFLQRPPEPLSFEKNVTEVLFGECLTPQKTRWRGWVCEAITQRHNPTGEDPAVVEVVFRSGERRIVIGIRPGSQKPVVIGVEAVGADYPFESNGPDAYVRFLVGRRVHPETRITLPRPPKSDGGYGGTGRPRQHEWGPRRGWYRFFHMPDVEGDYEERRLFTGRCVHITFGERECHTSHPCFAGVNCGKVASPAVDAWRSGFADTVNLGAILTEADLTLGPMAVFERLIAQADELRGKDGIVVFQDSCVSNMLGEDVKLFRTGQAARGVLIRASDNMRSQNAEMLNTFFERCQRRRDESPLRKAEGPVVNLVGYDPHRGRPELESLLRAAGIAVAVSFTPDYDIHRVDDVFLASLNVLYPARHRSRLYEILPECTGVQGFLPPPPYGVRGTRDWLYSIAARFGLQSEAERAFQEHLQHLAPHIEHERSAAHGIGVILIVSGLDTEVLTDPPACLGVPLVAMLQDLGFEVTIFYRVAERTDQVLEPEFRRLRGAFPDLPIRTFHDPDDLGALLRQSSARLVYSDVFDDQRVTDHGKVAFDLRHLPMGLEGALWSARLLNHKARIRFFDRYRDYLGDAIG